MTPQQRAFIAALVYVRKNKKHTPSHSIGVKALSHGAEMREFRGEWLEDSISVRDNENIHVVDKQFYTDPWGVMLEWIGKRHTDYIKVLIPDDRSSFSGRGGDNCRFEGTYHPPSDKVEIHDSSQDVNKYGYRGLHPYSNTVASLV